MSLIVIKGGSQVRQDVTDPGHIGACRRMACNLADSLRFHHTDTGRVGVVATEMATNLLRYGKHGELLIQPVTGDGRSQIELLAVDRGPGMGSIEDCMRDGFSTAGTLGTGLGAVKRMSDVFDIYSQRDAGTVVLARIGASEGSAQRPAAAADGLQFGTVSVPMRGEIECGDIWSIAQQGLECSVLVVDGLGHGPLAASAARDAADTYAHRPFAEPEDTMRTLHQRLNGGRGAAAACAIFHADASVLRYAGIGNISGCVVADGTQCGMLSHNGTLGMSMARAQGLPYAWPAESVTVMHSDGLSARWTLSDYPGIDECHPAIVAAVLLRDFSRNRDDATCVVVRRKR